MRIGRVIIDTDNMDIEEIDILIIEFKKIRNRKLYARRLNERMTELLNDAKEHGFLFSDKDFGQILEASDYTVYDTGEEGEEDVD